MHTDRTFLPRRSFLSQVALGGLVASSIDTARAQQPEEPIAIGSRRELFIDRALIDRLKGVEQRLQHPVPREVSVVHDELWEGTGSGYHSVFQDGDRYRMYYKAWHLDVQQAKLNTGRHPLYCCYAESPDGIQWTKPELGIHTFAGSRENNITMVSGQLGELHVDAGHPAVFKDDNPDRSPDAVYKAIVRSSRPNGLLPFKSPDGLHWTPMTDKPLLVGLGAFDSQNLAFWDPTIGKYRAYWRIFSNNTRAIRTATSDDMVHWGPHKDITYEDSPSEHLYTNQIKPYHRAPHLLIGFPTRYVDRGWSSSMRALPERERREMRSSSSSRYGTAVTEGLLMASRDGLQFTRWNEAFLRPGPQRSGSWHYGQQYIGWHVVQTKSSLVGAADELSLYASEDYWHGKGSIVRRYSLRLDGFVALSAGWEGGEVITHPITFSGAELSLNASTSAAGSLRVELQAADGGVIDGYGLSDCDEVFGDSVDRRVTWKGKRDLSQLRNRPVRLRFQLKDADLFALCFEDRPQV